MSGKFTGAGVGPGDPELMTLKALRVIRECSVIAVPVSDPELKEPVCSCEAARRLHQEQSLQSERDGDEAKVTGQDGHTGNGRYSRYLSGCVAYQTARKACPEIEQKDVLFLPMPMIKEKERLKEIHDLDVRAVAELLDREKDVVFLTLGDPSVYSTCMYVHRRLKRMGYDTALVPGVASFCAAAARMDCSLAENREELHILPASYDIEEGLKLPGTKVLMKAGRKLGKVKALLAEKGLEAKMVENCGMEGERIFQSTEEIPEQAGYYSLLVVKDSSEKGADKKRGNRL